MVQVFIKLHTKLIDGRDGLPPLHMSTKSGNRGEVPSRPAVLTFVLRLQVFILSVFVQKTPKQKSFSAEVISTEMIFPLKSSGINAGELSSPKSSTPES